MSVDWNSIAIGVGMTALAHPFTYTKVLVQLGHEPLNPVLRRNIFFRKQLQYPSVFEYIKYIKKCDGYGGLYRGLMPRIFANITTSLTYRQVYNTIQFPKAIRMQAASQDDISEFLHGTTKEMLARCAAVIASQPFHVIAIRTMAQFVGKETIYNNMYSSVVEIYHEDGILGFFAGLAPRLASEIISIWLCNLLSHLVNTYVLTDTNELRDLRQYTQMVMGYIVQTAVYPLSVTSTIMATNGTRLQAGNPPFVPNYTGWFACLRDLHKNGEASRGSGMFFRKAVTHVLSATSVPPVPAPSFS